MLIHIKFESQVRRLAGCAGTSVDVLASDSLEQIVCKVAKAGTESLRSALLDEQESLRSSILIFFDCELVSKEQKLVLQDGSELTLTTLISGG